MTDDATDLSWMQGSDLVQARNTSPDGQVLVTEFYVSTVVGTVVSGSDHFPDGLDAAAGWSFELISRNLVFPTTPSLIDATFPGGQVLRLIGMGSVWSRADNGQPVDSTTILAFALVIT